MLFIPTRLTAVACYASRPMKARLSFRSQNVPPPPPKPLHKQYVDTFIYLFIFIPLIITNDVGYVIVIYHIIIEYTVLVLPRWYNIVLGILQ